MFSAVWGTEYRVLPPPLKSIPAAKSLLIENSCSQQRHIIGEHWPAKAKLLRHEQFNWLELCHMDGHGSLGSEERRDHSDNEQPTVFHFQLLMQRCMLPCLNARADPRSMFKRQSWCDP